MNFFQKHFFAFVLICTFSLLFSQAVLSQDFSSIDRDLEQLENLIADMLQNTQEQQKLWASQWYLLPLFRSVVGLTGYTSGSVPCNLVIHL